MNIDTPEGMEAAVEWQKRHVAQIREGGLWLVPRSGTIIKIRHSVCTAVFVTFPGMSTPEPTIKRVFRAMGWQVEETEETNPEFPQ